MRIANKLVCMTLALCLGGLTMFGCADNRMEEPDFSGVREIAELASLECYYHNVVKFHRDADGYLFGLGGIGEKNMWFEYDGIVRMGFNIDEVSISAPDASGTVTVSIPGISILGRPDIDAESMTDPIESNGLFTSMTGEEKRQALADAQSNLIEVAEADESAKLQAKERGQSILAQYIKNVGEAFGREYTVRWVEAKTSE